jgi:mono/diheme cytochrome c family protein
MLSPRIAARVVGLGLFAVALGCGQSNSSPPPAKAPAVAVSAAPTNGKGLFEAHCTKCHAVEGTARKGKGPSLAHVAAEPEHTAEWIAAHVRNPRAHEPSSKMPAFESKLKPEEIKSVADYLSTLK